MARSNHAAPWQATAAYLYVLRLDAASLAWEYLRRNADYRDCWRQHRRCAPDDAARPWGLVQLEDPRLDARLAHPVWDDQMPTLLYIRTVDAGDVIQAGAGLDLWQLSGLKDVVALGAGAAALRVRTPAHGTTLHLRLGPGVLEGRPAQCLVPLDTRLHAQAALLAARAAHFAPRRAGAVRPAPCASAHAARLNQANLRHLRALQALDGVLAGASQRRVAEVLYGRERVCRDWHADSALRGQLRHSLARAFTLMRGGYRGLAGLRPGRSDT